jgi:hypothetical protein
VCNAALKPSSKFHGINRLQKTDKMRTEFVTTGFRAVDIEHSFWANNKKWVLGGLRLSGLANRFAKPFSCHLHRMVLQRVAVFT